MATKKELKKIKEKNTIKVKNEESNEIERLIKIIVIIVVIFGLFTLISYIVEKKNNKKEEPEVKIQYSKILVGSLLAQTENEYFVLASKEEDKFVSLYNSYISYYVKKDNALKVYTSNIDDALNSPYSAEQSNILVANINDLKMNQTTLFHVKDKQIVEALEGREAITNYLENLLK